MFGTFFGDNMETYKFTEIFRSFQGEGTHTGKNTMWLRWFQCNLNCNGFGQVEPTKPETHVLPYETIDIKDISVLEELPVFEFGCDSSYSWSKRFEHLAHNMTAVEIANWLENLLRSDTNPDGKFKHPVSGQETHMCFTGGEPMMRPSQRGTIAVMQELARRDNLPKFVTIETNGTQKLSREYVEFLQWFDSETKGNGEWFWSFSPKLFNTSGEEAKKAIKPDVIYSYQSAVSTISSNGHLKFVVNGTDATWNELDEVITAIRNEGVEYPVWIMPVGATKEQQETEQVKAIVHESLKRGYNISGRLHAHMLGNGLNT